VSHWKVCVAELYFANAIKEEAPASLATANSPAFNENPMRKTRCNMF
jgi:hypothetical protein